MAIPTKGSLAQLSFIQVLKEAASSQLTGMIRVEKGPIIKVVYVQQGTIAFASSNEKSDRLTEVLKRSGKLTSEQIEDAQSRLKPNVSLGKTLVELGYISPKDLLWGARAQVEGILHQLLFWSEGNYQVLEGPLPKEVVSLGLPVPHVLYDGILRTQDRDWILQQIVSPQAVYQLSPDFHEKNANWKLPAEAVVSRINGKRPLEEIAQNAGLDTFEVCKTVAALQLLQLVERVQEQPIQVPLLVTETQTEQAMEMARTINAPREVSLGQVLQIPTMEELQEEPDPEPEPESEPVMEQVAAEPEVAPTIMLPKPQTEEPETKEEEDVEEPIPFVENSSVKMMPSGHVPKFSFSPGRNTGGRPRKINWRNLALIMAVVALAAVGGVTYYMKMQRADLMQESARNMVPLKKARIQPKPATPTMKIPAEESTQQPKPATSTPGTPAGKTALQTPPAQAPSGNTQTPANPTAPSKPVSQQPVTTKPAPAPSQPPVTTKPTPASQQTPAAAKPAPATSQPPVTKPVQPPAPASTSNSKPVAQTPAPAIASGPMSLLKGGNLPAAAAAWQKELEASRSKFTIQLEIACQAGTVQEAVGLVPSANLLVIPLTYHGQSCYRILYGVFSNETSAETARGGLPSIFLKQEAPARVVAIGKILK